MSMQWTPGQRAALGGILQSRRQAILAQLELHHGGQSRAEHARAVLQQDADDAPQRAADREVDLALTDHLVQELAALDDALARLHEPGFGVCLDCGQTIALDRLRAAPDAVRCVECAGRHEQRFARAG